MLHNLKTNLPAKNKGCTWWRLFSKLCSSL